jgi:hypothetical protein
MGLIQAIPQLLQKHGGWILTTLSVFGLTGTAVLVANEAPKAQKELEEELHWKIHHRVDELMDISEKEGKDPDSWTDDEHVKLYNQAEAETTLTFGEKFDIVAPIYLPAFLVWLLTAGCMIGAQVFNVRQQTILIAAYGMLSEQYSNYRKNVQQEIGTEKERQIYISSQKQLKALREENAKLREENAPQLYEFATLPGVIFEAKPEHMNNVFYHMMWVMLNSGEFSLKDLYEHVGIPKYCYNEEDAEEYGWEAYENEISWGSPAVDFSATDIQAQNGQIVHVLNPYYQPYKLGLDYGGNDSSIDNLYSGYDYDMAVIRAQQCIDLDVEKFEQPELWFQHSF